MSTPETVAQAAREWLGTPYHHHGRVKGSGVDCAMLLAEVYEACGMVAAIDAGFYPHDWHLHRSEELFLQWVERSGGREVEAPRMGDVGLFRYGRTWSHGAICVGEDGLMVHAYIGRGVILTRLREEPLSGRDRRFFTLFD